MGAEGAKRSGTYLGGHVDVAPKTVAGGPARLLPPVESLSVRVLGKLRHHPDRRVRELAEAERSRRANQRRGLVKFDRLTAAWRLRQSAALAQAEAVLDELPLSDAAKARISRLLRRAPTRRFRDSAEAPRVAEICRRLLTGPDELIKLLRQAEESGRLQPGTADSVAAERHGAASGFLGMVGRIVRELGLERLDPKIRGYLGRPSTFRWTHLVEAIKTEIKRESPGKVWPMVEPLLRPLMEASGDKIYTDAAHIQRRAGLAKRRSRNGREGSPSVTAWAEVLESSEFSPEAWADLRAVDDGRAAVAPRG